MNYNFAFVASGIECRCKAREKTGANNVYELNGKTILEFSGLGAIQQAVRHALDKVKEDGAKVEQVWVSSL